MLDPRRHTREVENLGDVVRGGIAAMERDDAARAEHRLRDVLTEHQRGDRGVLFDSRAWTVTASR